MFRPFFLVWVPPRFRFLRLGYDYILYSGVEEIAYDDLLHILRPEYIYSDRSICICCLITYTLILLFFLSQVLRCVSVFSFQLCAQVLSSVFICFQYSTPELLEPVCFVTTDCIVAMTSCENNTEYLRYWVTKLRQKYKYIVMQYRGEQCNAMPSFWKRQARHTHTSNPQIH